MVINAERTAAFFCEAEAELPTATKPDVGNSSSSSSSSSSGKIVATGAPELMPPPRGGRCGRRFDRAAKRGCCSRFWLGQPVHGVRRVYSLVIAVLECGLIFLSTDLLVELEMMIYSVCSHGSCPLPWPAMAYLLHVPSIHICCQQLIVVAAVAVAVVDMRRSHSCSSCTRTSSCGGCTRARSVRRSTAGPRALSLTTAVVQAAAAGRRRRPPVQRVPLIWPPARLCSLRRSPPDGQRCNAASSTKLATHPRSAGCGGSGSARGRQHTQPMVSCLPEQQPERSLP